MKVSIAVQCGDISINLWYDSVGNSVQVINKDTEESKKRILLESFGEDSHIRFISNITGLKKQIIH